ncbi:hypothetical protein TVAG_019770 [Trichomonas vaginalis G3]|uniref:Uncharacterized protein n=1 Tax=Trichomonas vaginalis (strain ATCC PRA-98 / G3) TaxID=412133 RepID=A2DX49_TRIV3|nr:hypothetical protein TVAGG3_0185950 [Trichomonas vaginalis G3]EAY15076.1 hypothetical protein TVAG_019770 [Trichomonas vaginalis G3]KAI5549642.1 hypothetical protein TVAGG3_0185950 [Trichomonas vaginalis G3]|eukprot:XP_001327299.1 hypothetical protein [Trichomonas vaginalis G3]
MSRTYQRRLEQFQARLQQSLSLADDEIDRLTQYLNSVHAECLDIEDKLHRYENQFVQHQKERSGKKIKEESFKNAGLARLESNFNAEITRLTKEHSEKMNQMRDEYIKMQNENDEKSQKEGSKEINKLDYIISKLQTLIERENKKMEGIKDNNEEEEDTEDENDDANTKLMNETLNLQNKKIKSLKASIKQRESERLELLELGKVHFQQAMQTLETNEANHLAKMSNLRETLENLDKTYQQRFETMRAENKKAIISSKKRYLKAQKKLKQIQTKIVETEQIDQQKIAMLSEKRSALKFNLMQIRNKNTPLPSHTELHNIEKQISSLKQILAEHDAILKKHREENHYLKQEISKQRHLARIISRRSALGI